MKLMIIGIDALDPRLLFENIDMFPNMKKIYQEGSHSSYDGYVYGYGSMDNWISIYTGLSPQQHGIIKNINTKTKKRPNYDDYKDKQPFWKVLNDRNIRVAMWRGLATSPGEKIKGYMITGEPNYEFGESKIQYESMVPLCDKEDGHICSELLKENLGYPHPPKKPLDYGYSWVELFEDNSILSKILDNKEYYRDGYLYLEKELNYYKRSIINVQNKYPTDLLFYYTQTLDLIQHLQSYDSNRELALESMGLVDNFIGELQDVLKPDNIMIISDHGISSFKEVLESDNIDIQRESFGWRDQAIWLENGEIIVKARNGGFLSGNHDIKATFLASGKDIKQGQIKDMRTLDLYPTILDFFEIEVPEGRDGYVVDIFKKENLTNRDKLLRDKDIEYKKIAIIQNFGVSEFNTVINEIFLDNRFCELTLFCEDKYNSIFETNPRLSKVLDADLNKNMLEEFDTIFIGYKNDATKEVRYMKLL